MESSNGLGAKVAIPRLKRPNQQTVLLKPPRISSGRVDKAHSMHNIGFRSYNRAYWLLLVDILCELTYAELKCSGTRPRCINCTKYNKDCIYHLSRRDRLREATYKSEVLSALLKDIRGALDNEHTMRIDDTLKEFENDTSPPSPSVRTKSWKKRSRMSSPDEMDCDRQAFNEARASSSVGFNEDLDFLEEDVLRDPESIEASCIGRNFQIQCMPTLQRKPDQSRGGPSEMPYAVPRDSKGAASKRSDALYECQRQSAGAKPLSSFYSRS
ncbi:hypothetical protein COCHEDRAFT_1147991 [Bipolaris maydis C5]|uniref:Zn(2)-C6 fungal-type domain-containing protein n=1 Tax=Cochliobolus heterostrophus (strain C5 / ATCC 48332 / race O) TaxID=701091 RepID=M2UCH3_COCH5|nr:hypothetical protein COCHEDRAFT_1147991 [Bipolaris maydis C5]KAJ6208624.1 hypothetical protein PSV09DRAFT_1147991 [Bipolaris maydis]